MAQPIPFELHPTLGVGPIAFGMPRDRVRRILNAAYLEFFKPPGAKVPLDDFRALNLHVYYDEDALCSGMEFWPGSTLSVQGREVLRRPIPEVLSWLRALDPAIVVRDSLVLSHTLGLSLYVPDMDEEPDARVESAGTFVRWTGLQT